MIARRASELLGRTVVDSVRVGGGCISPAFKLTLAGGEVAFAKTHPDPPPDFFAAEARGLAWLRASVTVPVPDVLALAEDVIVMSWVEQGSVTAASAEDFGRSLAALHATSTPSFGAARDGYIGPLPLPNATAADWPTFYAERRLRPYVRRAVDSGGLDPGDAIVFDHLCAVLDRISGPPEHPALLHGDLWNGNVLWGTDGRGWLVDPAAHGGHRETDVAMLLLFGSPHPRILAAYQEAAPLADGWQDRIPLHQLHPLLVHAVLFDGGSGGGYGRRAIEIARRYVSASGGGTT